MPETSGAAAGRHAHPMPGWIAVVPIPEPKEEKPCATCGEVHPAGRHPLVEMLGGGPPVAVVRAVVLEVGEAPEHVVPFGEGATVFYTDARGIDIGDCRFMPAANVIAWE
jgi:hypothetical protein